MTTDQMTTDIRHEAHMFLNANRCLRDMQKMWKRKELTTQQFLELRKMAITGNIDECLNMLGKYQGR